MPLRKETPESLEKPSGSAEMLSSKVSSNQRKVSQRILERKISYENSEKLSRKTIHEKLVKPSLKRSKKQVGIPSNIIPSKTSKGPGKKKASINLKMPSQNGSMKPSKKVSSKSLGTNAKIAPTSQKNSETLTKAVVKRQSNATCVICKKNFTSDNLLNDHNIKHHFIRHCPNCPKTFRQTRKFILHLRTHLNDFPYQCKFCLENFNEKDLYMEHKKTHVTFKWLRCPLCSEVFYHAHSFMVHQHTHKGPPFPCNYCKAVFSNIRDRNVHSKNHVHRCVLCTKEVVAFPTILDLFFHTNFAHQEALSNDEAQTSEDCVSIGNMNLEEDGDSDSMDDLLSSDDESLADIDDNYQKDAVESVYTLKRKDKFICFICYDLYPSSELLKSHMKAHKWFPCNFCPEFFVDPEVFHNHKCHCVYAPRADANCSTEMECRNCEETTADDTTSHTFEDCVSTGSTNLEESNDRESRNDLFSSDTESLADIYYSYQKMLLPKSYFAENFNCSSEIECENCKKTPSKVTIEISGDNMNNPQSIVSKFQAMKYDIVQLINFIEYVKCKKLPLDVATLNRIGLHSTSLRIILTDNKIRCCFPSECITEIEDMYFKLQDYNQTLCDMANNTSEQCNERIEDKQ